MNGFRLAATVVAPASQGRALRAQTGDRVRIKDLEGQQVGDLMAWCVADPGEYLSPAHTVTANWRIIPRVGDILASNRRRAMFKVLADTVGYHDLIVPCCDAEAYLNRYNLADHRSCKTNLEEALAELGLDYPVHGERAVNVFMKTRIGGDGAMIYEEPTHPAGSHLDLDCLVDVVLALSACPQDQTPDEWLEMYPNEPRTMDADGLTSLVPAALLADFMDGLAIMDGRGLTEGFGHLSARVETGFVITPALAPGLATRDDLLVVGPAGEPVLAPEGRRPALETPLHAALYRSRADIGALCRTHSPAAVAWGLRGEPFLPSHGFGLMLGDAVPYHPDGDLITTPEAGDRAAAALGEGRALFLKGNGLIVAGRTLREAVIRAVYLEEACRATLAAGLTRPAAPFSPGERAARARWHDAELARAWHYYSRRPSTTVPK